MCVGLGTGTTVAELVPVLGADGGSTSPASPRRRRRGAGRRPRARRPALHRHRPARPGHRRGRPGRPGRLAGQGRGRRPDPGADRGRGRRPVRRHRVLRQAGRPAAPAGAARAPGLRAGGHAARAARARCCGTRPRRPTAACWPTTTARSATRRRCPPCSTPLPGVVSHGLFPPSLVSSVLIGRGTRWRCVRSTEPRGRAGPPAVSDSFPSVWSKGSGRGLRHAP